MSSPQERLINTGGGGSDILTTYTPGMVPDEWRPGQARLVKAGSDLVFQIHYTADGTAGADQTSIGLVFAKEPPKEKIVSMSAANRGFKIPAGDGNYSAEATLTVRTPMTLVNLFPHLHLRGKAFQYDVIYPDGRHRNHSEGGQVELKLATFLHAGGASGASRRNAASRRPRGGTIRPTIPPIPDPTVEVSWGEQSWEEMLVGFMNVAVDPKAPIAGLPTLKNRKDFRFSILKPQPDAPEIASMILDGVAFSLG